MQEMKTEWTPAEINDLLFNLTERPRSSQVGIEVILFQN